MLKLRHSFSQNKGTVVNIKFYLHSFTSSEGKASIYIRIHADGLYEFRAAIHERIKRSHWNHKKQVVKAGEDYADEINERIERMKRAVASSFREKLDNGEVLTVDALKSIIRPRSKAQVKEAIETITQVYQQWKEHYLHEKNIGNTGSEKGTNYARRFNQVVSKLNEFQAGITLTHLNADLLKKYRQFLIKEGLQDTTVQNHFKSIRALLAFKGMPNHFVNPPKAAKATKYDLTWSEVMQLYQTEYSTRKIKQAALIFVANCQLCLRYTDLYKVENSLTTVESRKYGTVSVIHLNQGKTGDVVFIPFPALARQIFTELNNQFPLPTLQASGSPFEFNRYLKQAAEEAGLTRKIRVTKSYNNNVVEEWEPLHRQISSHDARHTGYSRVREATKDKDLAEALLGHSNAGPYSHTDPLALVDSLLDAWQIINPR